MVSSKKANPSKKQTHVGINPVPLLIVCRLIVTIQALCRCEERPAKAVWRTRTKASQGTRLVPRRTGKCLRIAPHLCRRHRTWRTKCQSLEHRRTGTSSIRRARSSTGGCALVSSPYHRLPVKRWRDVTNRLVSEHPLDTQELVEIVLASWESIFASRLGTQGFHIGRDIFPKPQIMGFLLHELIPLELAARYPERWRGEISASDKDIVHIPDDRFSIEVKTSSNPQHIFGNRSYAQGTTRGKKAKSGYYLAVNFGKVSRNMTRPRIMLVRFGWLDSNDWIGQMAVTGQQSRLITSVETHKLLEIYRAAV